MKPSYLFALLAALVLGITAVFAIALIVLANVPSSSDWPGIVLLVFLSSLVIGLLIVALAHRFMSRPLNLLVEGMHRVAKGNFDTRLDEREGKLLHGTFADFNDMTESLLSVESLRESFVSNVSHEFKTPLAYIQGYATLLQDDDLTAEERKQYIGHIIGAINRLSIMIGNLLELSNLSRPNARLEMQVFSLDEQLRHVLAVLLPQIERKGINYELDLERVDIKGNESLLEDAWTNLISNSVKYTPAGGTVSITLATMGSAAWVTISDTGCGMTEEQVAHAFDRFYQGERSHTGEGSGLGLPIVRAIVRKHEGMIRIESEPGKGSAFIVALPY